VRRIVFTAHGLPQAETWRSAFTRVIFSFL